MRGHSSWSTVRVKSRPGAPGRGSIVAFLHHLCCFPSSPRLFPGLLPQDLPSSDLQYAHDHIPPPPPPALLTPRKPLNAALGAAAPLTAPREEAPQWQGLALWAFEACKGEGLPCAPDLGGGTRLSPPPPTVGGEPGTMGSGGLAPTLASWQSGEGVG